jgi:hypothetical protein
MPNTNSDIQRKAGFFHSLGKVITEDANSAGNEKYKSAHNVRSNEVWMDSISYAPTSASASQYADGIIVKQVGSASGVVDVQNNFSSPLYLYPLTQTNYQTWFMDTGTPSAAVDGFVPSSEWVKPLIGPVDVPNSAGAPSTGYNLIMFRPNGTNTISYSNAYYEVDYFAGLIRFQLGNTPVEGTGLGFTFDSTAFQALAINDATRKAYIQSTSTGGPRAIAWQYTGQRLSNYTFTSGGGTVSFEDSSTIGFTQSGVTYSAYVIPNSLTASSLNTGLSGGATAGYVLSNTGDGNFAWVPAVSGSGGVAGSSGTSGTSGISGSNGTSGTSGISGSNGTSGTSGISGSNGTSGTSGVSGSNGTSGTSGISGSNGTSGTSGISGSNGTSGTSGISGSNGTSGTSGISGSNGTSGTSGVSGSNGTSGTSGSSGTSGVSGSPSSVITDPNSGISISYGSTNSTIDTAYNTALDPSLSMPNTVGGIASGTTAGTLSGLNLVQLFDDLLFPTVNPTYTIPIIGLSSTITGIKEVGETISPAITLTGTENDANYFSQLVIQKSVNGGGSSTLLTVSATSSMTVTSASAIASQFGYVSPNNPNFSYAISTTDSGLVVPTPASGGSSTVVYSGLGNYTAGLAKKNNKGVTHSASAAVRSTSYPQAASTNFAPSGQTITGYYPYFYGKTSTQKSASDIVTIIQSGTGFTKVVNAGSGSLSMAFSATGEWPWFAVYSVYPTKSTWYENALNNGSIGGVTDLFAAPTTLSVISSDGYWTVTFKIYPANKVTTLGTATIA